MKITILGAGTWGMALGRMLYNSGHEVSVWSALAEEIDELRVTRRQKNLPDMEIPEGICFTKCIGEAVAESEMVVFAVPSVHVRATARQASPFLRREQILVDVGKGIEAETLCTLTEVIKSETGRTDGVIALSGPTHAEEVALDLPTTIVSACENLQTAELVQKVFSNRVMRVYTNTDVKGVELCGALKNIVALAAGIAAGLGYGDNTKAALLTRGLAEIKRLGVKMGCSAATFMGLAGMGDLIVTATSEHSRNNRCGRLLGEGCGRDEAVKRVGMVVEGINALPAAMELARRYSVDMPIIFAADKIVNGGAAPADVVKELMARDSKAELL